MKSSKTIRSAIVIISLISALTFSVHAIEVISLAVSPVQNVENYAPIAENLNFTTFKDVAIHGEFAAVDPEGDNITFQLASEPKKGKVETNGTKFVYTPASGKKGRDSFTYTAVDSCGNISEEASVTITIEKQSTKLAYSDMADSDANYAALRLAENNIYIGKQIGEEYFFSPTDTLSRGEFLALCMTTTGLKPLQGINRTGFSDDADIPDWEKAYISTALMVGMVQGYSTSSGDIIFASNAEISCAEAIVMLNNALKISDVSAVSSTFSDAVPVWASQAAANLNACSIACSVSDYSAPLSRSEAAKMLCASLDLLEERESGKSLLSWAW